MRESIDLAISSYRHGRYREAIALLNPLAEQGDYLARIYLSMALEKTGLAPGPDRHATLAHVENTESEVRGLARAVVNNASARANTPLMLRQMTLRA